MSEVYDQLEQTMHDWSRLDPSERLEAFSALPLERAEELLDCMNAIDQAELLASMPEPERRVWMRYLDPDDLADVLLEVSDEQREQMISLLDERHRHEVNALLAYAEDDAGGLMNPRFARLRPELTIEEAIRYLRKQSQGRISLEHLYVLDEAQCLLGEVALDSLLSARSDELVRDIVDSDIVTAPEDMDQEEVGALFARYGLTAMPVVDAQGRMKGLITADDVVDVIYEENTEDAQKFGGMEALDDPYLRTGFWELVKKRAGWLIVLLFGEMLTASAMARYEVQLNAIWYLAVFVPLIISSGGNSGSQASTLVVRAMAMGEVQLSDWGVVFWRELRTGTVMGIMVGLVGAMRIIGWQLMFDGVYGAHYMSLAMTVGVSLLGVVILGCLAGSMLPFLLRICKFDPASASAPFVATLVDVSGLIVYFSVASIFLAQAIAMGG